jgi:anthranilate phosphoribosyltransferase
MSDPFDALLHKVQAGEHLTQDEMTAALTPVMTGQCSEQQIEDLLLGLHAKGETVEEVAGAAIALRAQMQPIRHRFPQLLDTCGTGGGGSQLFNVSTTAALVIAAVGVPVAKHGNRSVTSRSGSADVLAELGVNIEATLGQVERCLDQLGICFCFAPLMHPAMRHVAAVRKRLKTRTIFNILGPLANPAAASHQLLGAGRPELRPLLAAALQRLGTQRSLVVSGSDGLGEVTLAGPTYATEITCDALRERQLAPEDFGLEVGSLASLAVTGPAESAAIVRSVLAGTPGPARDLVVINAAAGLITFHHGLTPSEAARRAAEALDSGASADLLARLVETSRAADI